MAPPFVVSLEWNYRISEPLRQTKREFPEIRVPEPEFSGATPGRRSSGNGIEIDTAPVGRKVSGRSVSIGRADKILKR